MPTRKEELLILHSAICSQALEVMKKKNQDYTGGSDDPFANFRTSEFLGVPSEIGILMRCMDKFQRIKSFVVNGQLAVKEESVNDAIQDVINYMILLAGVIKEKQNDN